MLPGSPKEGGLGKGTAEHGGRWPRFPGAALLSAFAYGDSN